MKNTIAFIAGSLLMFTACDSVTSKKQIHPYQSFELTNKGDTIKLVDGNSRKQGLWLMPISKDTVVYLNDTAYSVISPMTSGEMIRELKSGLTGSFVSYDSLGVESH